MTGTRTRAILSAVASSAFLLVASQAPARCLGGGVSVDPGRRISTIPTTPRIVVSGYGHAQKWAGELAGSLPAMVSANDRVPTSVVATYEGYGVVQTVLMPVRPLIPGRFYRLEIAYPGDGFLSEGIPSGWRVTAEAPEGGGRLRWVGPPRVFVEFPALNDLMNARNAHVAVPIEGGFGPVMVLATVRRLGDESDPPRRFLLSIEDGVVKVGRGHCGGSFDLRAGERY